MNVLFILVPIALALAGAGALAFRWAVNDGQFDDLESPAFRMLIDDDPRSSRIVSPAANASDTQVNAGGDEHEVDAVAEDERN